MMASRLPAPLTTPFAQFEIQRCTIGEMESIGLLVHWPTIQRICMFQRLASFAQKALRKCLESQTSASFANFISNLKALIAAHFVYSLKLSFVERALMANDYHVWSNLWKSPDESLWFFRVWCSDSELQSLRFRLWTSEFEVQSRRLRETQSRKFRHRSEFWTHLLRNQIRLPDSGKRTSVTKTSL